MSEGKLVESFDSGREVSFRGYVGGRTPWSIDARGEGQLTVRVLAEDVDVIERTGIHRVAGVMFEWSVRMLDWGEDA